ncbi:phosphatidate cytidylyltransferase [Vineibacter terrae]|uniref:Phosphatidate cytidylyltransferase n=1 Tax=Vineibacter terrae TaxID=2586908 RepID=A0A5C8PPA7_9HYPH|nr:phosphatidate cytidylyltransferase [Vineibacter terrae]TXL76721.1 phosphatidate cytidylyltransferase [Vineibacter terrae]
MAPSPAEAPRAGRFRDLAVRVGSAAVMAPLAIAAVWYDFPWFDLLVALATVLMVAEWRRMAGGRRRPGWLLFGYAYIALAVLAALWLRHDAQFGLMTFLWLLAAVWATDVFAFFTGRSLGGPRLAPTVSPSKTWSGLAGGVLAAALVSVAFMAWSAASGLWLALWGALIAIVAQLGDLAESAAKRHFGLKDSGRLIPGHGGILDRVDGLLAGLLFLAAVRLLGGGATPWN